MFLFLSGLLYCSSETKANAVSNAHRLVDELSSIRCCFHLYDYVYKLYLFPLFVYTLVIPWAKPLSLKAVLIQLPVLEIQPLSCSLLSCVPQDGLLINHWVIIKSVPGCVSEHLLSPFGWVDKLLPSVWPSVLWWQKKQSLCICK